MVKPNGPSSLENISSANRADQPFAQARTLSVRVSRQTLLELETFCGLYDSVRLAR